MTNRKQSGVLSVARKQINFNLVGNAKIKKVIKTQGSNSPGKLYKFKTKFTVKISDSNAVRRSWNMRYFYVPRINGKPDWAKIPTITITNRHQDDNRKAVARSHASFKIAYDRSNLYLRVECEKPKLLRINSKDYTDPALKSQLWRYDGCLEVYIDTAADGLYNLRKGYDNDDYRYDFAMGNIDGKTGPGLVWRFVGVFHQLAGGVGAFPSKEDAAKSIPCQFVRTSKGFAYEITFPQRYIEPLALKPGNTAGLGLYIHDKIGTNPSLATQQGAHCNMRPDLWPVMILK